MKKSKLIFSVFFITLVTITIILASCSKERIAPTPAVTLNAYSSPNTYLDSKKQAEQEFVIDSTGTAPIIGNQGTKIWAGKSCLITPTGDTITWPFKIKLVELYTPKDMIYYQMPTVASGNILETYGEIRLRAFKGTTELLLKPNGCYAQIEMPSATPKNYMRVHYGFGSTNWTDNPSSLGITSSLNPLFSVTSYGHLAQIARLGWVNCGFNASNSTSSNFTFTSTVDDLANVAIFIYIPSKKTVMQLSGLTSGQIPNGFSVKIVAIAYGANGQLYSFTQNSAITANTTIDVTMTATTDAILTSVLNGL